MEFYAVILFAYILLGILDLHWKRKYQEIVAVGLNITLWMPFVGRALGWW